MYEIKLNEDKKIDILDYYELSKTVDLLEEEREDFYVKISEKIKEVFEKLNLKTEEEKKDFIFIESIKMNFLIERTFLYLIRGNEDDFKKYYENFSIDNKLVKKIYENIKNYKNKDKEISEYFSNEEIYENYKNYEKDKFGIFYYFVFTMFYLEDYLLKLISNFSNIFSKSTYKFSETQNLHLNLAKVFSEDFSKSFYLFEKEAV